MKDASTLKEIDIKWVKKRKNGSHLGNLRGLIDSACHSDIDTSFFVLTVDLWSSDCQREVNLVRHSATSPSISAATSSSYPPPPSAYGYTSTSVPVGNSQAQVPMGTGYDTRVQGQYPLNSHQQAPFHNGYTPQTNAHQQSPTHNGYVPQNNVSGYPQNLYQQPQHQQQSHTLYQQNLPPIPSQHQQQSIPQQHHQHQSAAYYNQPSGSAPATPTSSSGGFFNPMHQNQGSLISPPNVPPISLDPRTNPSGMFTRNLIGSLCVSAFKLTDPDNNLGVWFILQDLSVRTEGSFRYAQNIPCQHLISLISPA